MFVLPDGLVCQDNVRSVQHLNTKPLQDLKLVQHALLIQRAYREAPFVCVQRDTQVLTEDHVLDVYQASTQQRRDPLSVRLVRAAHILSRKLLRRLPLVKTVLPESFHCM